MEVKRFLTSLNMVPTQSEILFIKKETDNIVDIIEKETDKLKIGAELFVGGSFAKGTLAKKKEYDVDIFARFDWRYENLSLELEKIIKAVSKKHKMKFEKMHGSRDYFRVKKGEILFEIIPVSKIKKPNEARNVTDLSYFHVNYARSKIDKKLANEIIIAKTFCKAQGVYGAESYIQGFSGYGLECLMIYYKTFEKMLKALVKVEDRIVLDPAKKYKDENEILINLNESKLQSPIILVDPTWKERNVLAALGQESFRKFQDVARAFLKSPSMKYFEDKEIDFEKMKIDSKKKGNEFVHVHLQTDKQEGDIAGTKMKKFTNFLVTEIQPYFMVARKEFTYHDKNDSNLYLSLKSKEEIIKVGPPVNIKSACKAFRKSNKNVFEKQGYLHARIKINYSAKRFILDWINRYKKKVKEMNITSIKVS